MKFLALTALVLAVLIALNANRLRSVADAVGKDIAQARSLVDAVGNDIDKAHSTADAVGKDIKRAHSTADAVGKDIKQAHSTANALRADNAKASPTQLDLAARAPKRPASAETPSSASSAVMNQARFWQLIGQARVDAGNDTGRQSELLKQRLAKLPAPSILKFDRIRHSFDVQAYSYDIWGGAYVIEDGCSDDCFRDFRGYVISLGQGPYEAALRNPDSLAAVAQDAETGNWEGADNPAPDAYASATGSDFPLDEPDLSGTPRGKPFDENDTAAMAARYPRLYARFR
jgi:Sec-independent protein translocase protein TatA